MKEFTMRLMWIQGKEDKSEWMNKGRKKKKNKDSKNDQ